MSERCDYGSDVLGLGNLMRSDDAVGMLILRSLTEDGRLPPEVRAIEGGSLGLDLLDSLRGISHLLALDAVDTGVAPGTWCGSKETSWPVCRSLRAFICSDFQT